MRMMRPTGGKVNDTMRRQDAKRDEAPIRVLFIKMPRCPACGSHRLVPYRTTRRGDVARIRYCRCEQCGQRTHLNIS